MASQLLTRTPFRAMSLQRHHQYRSAMKSLASSMSRSETSTPFPPPQNENQERMTKNTRHLADALSSSSASDRNHTRMALSRAITLVESRSMRHRRQADLLLDHLLQSEEKSEQHKSSFLLGIAGPPGAGKSTFIETLGQHVLENNTDTNLAVLCIDPSSSITGGSILGDKTRMTELSRHKRAYVRPSPTGGSLGGLSSSTSDSVALCTAAGYNLVFVETVGLGQSEVEIDRAVDMLLLLLPPGGGDELQGVKKGIVECADILVVNKADGHLLQAAKLTAMEYKSAMGLFRVQRNKKKDYSSWGIPPVILASAHTSEGIEEVWSNICKFQQIMSENGQLNVQRREQKKYWMWKYVKELIEQKTKENGDIRKMAEDMERGLEEGKKTPRNAAVELLRALYLV